jgi:hypothetical protein
LIRLPPSVSLRTRCVPQAGLRLDCIGQKAYMDVRIAG